MSPTQIELFIRDPGRWRAIYVEKSERRRPLIGDIIGADVHRLLAAYLRGQADIRPPGPSSSRWGSAWHPHLIAAAGLHHLPSPGTVEVEVRRVLELAGAAVVCVKDAEARGLVIDHKTGSLESAVDNLADDVQAALYAAEHLARTGAETIALRWIWYALDGSGSRAVEQVVGRDDIAPTVARCEQAIRAMEAERWRSLTSSKDSTSSGATPKRPPIQASLPLF